MGVFDNPVKDADHIHKKINYKVLRAAWDSYARIKRRESGATNISTPAWFALYAVKNYGGKFNKFNVEEIHLLKSFTTVHKVYDEIIESLSQNASNSRLVEHILETHPDLLQNVPDKFRNEERINLYLIGVIKEYKALLDNFYKKYGKKIDNAVKNLENKIKKGEITSNADDDEFASE